MAEQKLKILFVLQTPWGSGLGMSRVHYDLKPVLEAKGHQVDYLDGTILQRQKSRWNAKSTQELILEYLKKHASGYDIIDANQRCIPYPKRAYNFSGLVMYRSHGFPPLYRIAEQEPHYKKMQKPFIQPAPKKIKNHLGNLKRYLKQGEGDWALWASLNYADVVHCLNTAEKDYLEAYGIDAHKLVVIPNGIEAKLLNKPITQDLTKRKDMAFLGSWTLRKGISHLPELARVLQGKYRHLNLLGTSGDEASITAAFEAEQQSSIRIVNRFKPEQLAELLKETKVGLFPSYAEGFGLAVVEFLAQGIPVVAFDTPGPKDILTELDKNLLVPLGDLDVLKNRVTEILSMSLESYQELSEACFKRAEAYNYELVAAEFLKLYQSKLHQLEH